MPISIAEAKVRLDMIINKSRVDLYKPIQIAEVLHYARMHGGIDVENKDTYQNPSCAWRDAVTIRLTGKRCTSSARFQHDVWNDTAMLPEILAVLSTENICLGGQIESYIYKKYGERQGTVTHIINLINNATPDNFQLKELIENFIRTPGIKRSIDKAYEIVSYALFETVICAFEATVTITVPEKNRDFIREFNDLASVLLGIQENDLTWTHQAHIYRVGVTNAADRGLDMWANFGPAIQVKHLTLNSSIANEIVDQVESDHIVIVCSDADAGVIEAISRQIGWGRRVRGIVKESNLIDWYERCLRGNFSDRLANTLLETLREHFALEFPQTTTLVEFLSERGYTNMVTSPLWTV